MSKLHDFYCLYVPSSRVFFFKEYFKYCTTVLFTSDPEAGIGINAATAGEKNKTIIFSTLFASDI